MRLFIVARFDPHAFLAVHHSHVRAHCDARLVAASTSEMPVAANRSSIYWTKMNNKAV
jgi:vacuolar-type H+-ATPase catalytic subunit A/Vma1